MALVPRARGLLLVALLAGLLALSVSVVAWAEPRVEPIEATYYSNWFVGKPTASGEIYDPRRFTAAHPYLPFGTKLLVRYNGKGVYVTVNDRMPRGRYELDLSLAAARAIGITEVGIAVVDVEVVEEEPETS